MQKPGDSPGLETEQRARQLLGLNGFEREPRALPVLIEQLWRAEKFAPRVPYTGTFLMPMGQRADLDRIERVVALVVERHEALRSRLALENGAAILLPAAPTPFTCTTVSAAEIKAHEQGRSAPALAEFFSAPFELLQQPGFRARAFADEAGSVTLGVLMHHYFGDAWSSQILCRELEDAFAGRDLAPVTAQYSDYALFQRRALDKNLGAWLAYWQDRQRDAPPSCLPFDSGDDDGMLARTYFSVENDVLRALTQLSRQDRVSLGVICLAALQLAMSRWCGVRDVSSSLMTANRLRPQFRDTVGHLLSAIPVRSVLDPATRLRAFLPALAKQVYDGLARQDLSVDLYEEIFHPAPPFCVPRFNFIPRQENFTAGGKDAAMPAVTGIRRAGDVKRHSAYPDLRLQLLEYPDGLMGRFVHTKRLSFDRIAALIGLYQHNLHAIVRDPDLALSAFL